MIMMNLKSMSVDRRTLFREGCCEIVREIRMEYDLGDVHTIGVG